MDAALVERLERRINSRLRTMGLSHADCEDIRQQVFVDFLQKESSVQNSTTWVSTVAYRKGLSAKYRSRHTSLEFEPICSTKMEVRLDVRRALSRCTDDGRELIARRYRDGHTIEELVGLGFGSESTVKRHVRRATGALRERLGTLGSR